MLVGSWFHENMKWPRTISKWVSLWFEPIQITDSAISFFYSNYLKLMAIFLKNSNKWPFWILQSKQINSHFQPLIAATI